VVGDATRLIEWEFGDRYQETAVAVQSDVFTTLWKLVFLRPCTSGVFV